MNMLEHVLLIDDDDVTNYIHTMILEKTKSAKNVKAVFNGHDHDEDAIKMFNNTPYIFDAHVGGNWGTEYRGFRIVELRKDNSLLTYVLNPTEKINEQTL